MKYKYFTSLASIILFSMAGHTANGGRGGGDPRASALVRVARQIQTVLPEHPAYGEIGRAEFARKVDEIDASLEGIDPLVVFPPQTALPCIRAQVFKMGCVPGEDGIAYIAGEAWDRGSLDSRVQLTVMEISLQLKKGALRYDFAPDIATQVRATGFELPTPITPAYRDAMARPQRLADLDSNPIIKASTVTGNPPSGSKDKSRAIAGASTVAKSMNCEGTEYPVYYTVPHSNKYSPGYIWIGGGQFFLRAAYNDGYLAQKWDSDVALWNLQSQKWCTISSWRNWP